jgi:hypothetical protein
VKGEQQRAKTRAREGAKGQKRERRAKLGLQQVHSFTLAPHYQCDPLAPPTACPPPPNLFFGGGLAVHSQKAILKIKRDKIMCFFTFTIAIIRPKFKKNLPISILFVRQKVAKNIEGCFLNILL